MGLQNRTECSSTHCVKPVTRWLATQTAYGIAYGEGEAVEEVQMPRCFVFAMQSHSISTSYPRFPPPTRYGRPFPTLRAGNFPGEGGFANTTPHCWAKVLMVWPSSLRTPLSPDNPPGPAQGPRSQPDPLSFYGQHPAPLFDFIFS